MPSSAGMLADGLQRDNPPRENPLRGGMLHVEELPLAHSRSAADQTIGAANRDPAGHQDPNAVDFRRQESHLAFGAGPHGCLGAHLARLEMRVALEEWHRGIPDYQLAPGAVPEADWPAALIGLDHLPLVFVPATREVSEPRTHQ